MSKKKTRLGTNPLEAKGKGLQKSHKEGEGVDALIRDTREGSGKGTKKARKSSAGARKKAAGKTMKKAARKPVERLAPELELSPGTMEILNEGHLGPAGDEEPQGA